MLAELKWSSGGAARSSWSLTFTFAGRIQSIVDENGVGAVREEAPFVWAQCVDTSLKSLWLFGSCVRSRFFSAGIWPTELDESVLLSDWTPCLFFFFLLTLSFSQCVWMCMCLCILNLVYRAAEGWGSETGKKWWWFCFARLQPPVHVCPSLSLFLSLFFTFFFRGPALGQAGPFGSILSPSHGWWLMALKKKNTNTLQNDSSTCQTYLIFAHKHVSVHKHL